MAVTRDFNQGQFYGRALVSASQELGGSRDVFVKLGGNANEYVFPTFGGKIMNPFKGAAKLYAGDLAYFKTDDNGVKPEIYILKVFEVVSASGTTINVVRDGYSHVPFVGDILTIAPSELGGKGEALTVTNVAKSTVADKGNVWAVTLAKAPTKAPVAGDILVDADSDGNMLVKEINMVAPCDYDFFYNPAADPTDEDDFENARYHVNFALGGLMYTHKMSPLPDCVKATNTSKVNGWFKVGAWGNF